MNNRYFLLLFIFIFALGFLSAVVSLNEEMCGDTPCNLAGYFSEAPDNAEVVASNVDFDNDAKQFSFKEGVPGGMVGIKEEKGNRRIYENIEKGFIQMDDSGKISKATLTAGIDGTTLYFGGDEIDVPPRQTVHYDASTNTINIEIAEHPDQYSGYAGLYTRYDSDFEGTPNKILVTIPEGFEDTFLVGSWDSAKFHLQEGTIISEGGVLRVPAGSSAQLDGVFIDAKGFDVEILDEPGFFDTFLGNIKDEGNYVRIPKGSTEMVINCDDCNEQNNFEVTIPADVPLDSIEAGYLDLPERGYYKEGDRGSGVLAVQKAMGVPEKDQDGIYGSQTKSYVVAFQEEYNKNHPESPISVDGVFGEDSQKAFFNTAGKMTVTPSNSKIILEESGSGWDISASGDSTFDFGFDSIKTQGGEVLKKIGGFLSPSAAYAGEGSDNLLIPVKVNLKDGEGNDNAVSFSKDYHKRVKGTRSVTLGGKEYLLENGEAYILTAGQTSFTEAVAPPLDAEELQNLPEDFRESVAGAGHMGIIYVDPDSGQVRLTESDWDGVHDVPFTQSHMYQVRNQVGGVYYFPEADSHKIIEGSKADAEKNIGWFFTDVDSFVGTAAVNKITGNDYSEYRSCAGHVCMVASYGGADLLDEAEYVPLQNSGEEALQKYISSYGIKGTIGDKSYSEVGASLLQKSISAIDKISYVKSAVGLGPSETFATPPQIILGGVEEGVILPLEPQVTGSFLKDMSAKLERIGYSGASPTDIRQFQEDYNSLALGPKIPENGNFDYSTVKALERYCSKSDRCD